MSWKVTPLATFDLTGYIVAAFGRNNPALPFVTAFVNSSLAQSDLVEMSQSNAAALRRAIVKASGLPFNERDSGKKTKKGKKIILRTIDTALFERACNSLGIAVETLARENAEGKTVREHIYLVRTAQ
jgi:hypothetical protein